MVLALVGFEKMKSQVCCQTRMYSNHSFGLLLQQLQVNQLMYPTQATALATNPPLKHQSAPPQQAILYNFSFLQASSGPDNDLALGLGGGVSAALNIFRSFRASALHFAARKDPASGTPLTSVTLALRMRLLPLARAFRLTGS
jgi:hypothetical protein